ncbi:MAG: DUF4838 domain-containing protein, partial [Planctomycetes bacterium]|nr:DUF4838 domain-containing protein [Planctomycetota bacterium]
MNLSEMLSLRQFLGLILVLNVFATGCRTSSAAPAADLASDGRCMMPVVVGQNASDNVQKHADQLAEYLGRMGGTEFRVKRGDGSSGIVVGLPADFESCPFEVRFKEGPFHREDYLLRSNAQGLWILGSTELAVRHGVWDVLHRLGHRQFFPGDTWEVVPRKDDLSIAVNCTESPDFYARRIWYNWGMRWGYNREPYSQWNARNRMARGFLLRSGHAYGRIIRGHRKEFEKHPEYYALVNGKRKKGGGAKLCVSNPGLQKLVVDYAVERFKKKPDMDSISLEPSDGGGWCECEDCKELGSPSDRALLLANKAAKAVNKLGFGEKYIGMYAYNRHSPPPSIKVHPNVIISVTTAFHTGGWNTKKIIEGWRDQGATLGIYDYFSVVAWDWNLPRRAKASRPHRIAPAIREFYRHGARFYDCESGDCWGPCGLGYYLASRVMWDVNEADRIDEIIDDFLQKAFGPAREPMAEFYHLITEDKRRRSPADLVGRMYRHLAEARRKAGENEAVKRRINDLILYTRYVELYEAYAAVAGEAKKEAKKAVLKHAYRIRERMMVHSYGLWARLIGQKAAHTKAHPIKDDRALEDEDILEMLRSGIEENEPVEIGFEPVEFSRKLVPARGLK